MKKFALQAYGRIVAWILTALGLYTSCDTIEPRVEYGTPTADFVVKGKVVDESTRQPVKDMAVTNKSHTAYSGNNTVKTDANGNYALEFTATAFGPEEITVYTSDADGKEDGSYLSDTIRIKASELKQIAKKRGSWYFGKFEGNADFEIAQAPPAVEPEVRSNEYKETPTPTD